ncbi:site-specific integrase [Pseudogemmobacter humi]|uniref:Phage integrase family protein n=1 Tax=Pseudogemmobacter humi TaxID=2483812 RepID=A0A3P5XFU1_9RHOB|nr:site-specific integrase [Pseudogemmobacter humi]VDC27458.1 Phage integrase family protein [Pseudogemmobacter humi]
MGTTSRLVRRGAVFYFRMSVPRRLVARVGRSELSLSLRTGCRYAATQKCRALSITLDRYFLGLERMTKTTIEQINDQLRRYFQTCLNRNEEIATIYPSDPVFDIYAEAEGLSERVKGYREQLRSRVYAEDIQDEARELLEGIPASASTSGLDALHHACRGVLRARIDSAQHLVAELTGEPQAPRDAMFLGITADDLPLPPGEVAAPMQSAPVSALAAVEDSVEQISVTELVERFQKAKSKGKWSVKTASDLGYTMQIVFSVIQPEMPITSITDKHVRALRDLIVSLPPNAQKSKEAAGETLLALAEANTGGATLSYATQEKRLRFFKTMLGWAVDEGYLAKIPGAKVKVERPERDAGDDRAPYSQDQLGKIFRSPVYTGRKSEAHSNTAGTLLLRDGKFWVPLIALYSGMRLGEIVQLLRADIKQENGVWFFDNAKTPGISKQLKTNSSIRQVPIHKHLIEAGFLRYVDGVKSGERLFPELKSGNDGYFSTNFSKWWTRYAKDCGFYDKRTAFHSFRHSFIDAMRAVEAPAYAIEAVVGHKNDSINARYGSGVKLAHMRELVDQISYDLPELDALRMA